MIPAARIAPRARPGLALLDAHAPEVEATWRALEHEADPGYFLTWGWVSTWLACLPPEEAPALAVVSDQDGPVAACFLGRRRVVRHRIFPSRSLFLNTTGFPSRDELTIEYNAVLCSPRASLSLARFLDALPGGWDELALPAASRAAFPGSALGEPLPRHVVRIDREASTHFVDLAKVRAAKGGYLDLIGSRTRKQIRRAGREFGALEIDEASDLPAAMEIYTELVSLHTRAWQARGLPGAFADPWFDAFHRKLIADRLPHGEIQLLRFRASGKTIGCLYSMISSGRVFCYQTGFESFDDFNLKPGYLCHAEAVRLNADAGRRVYDLLAGDTRYKLSLGTEATPLVWARIQRPLLRFRLEETLRRWKRGLQSRREGAAGADAAGEAD